MAFTNLDPAAEPIEDSFTSANMIPGYKDGISHQWGSKLAKNTSHNRRLVWQRYYDHVHINESWSINQEKDFLTSTDYATEWAGVPILIYGESNSIGNHRFVTLSLSYQIMYADGDQDSQFEIKYLAGGGFRIKRTEDAVTANRTLECVIVRAVTIAGVAV